MAHALGVTDREAETLPSFESTPNPPMELTATDEDRRDTITTTRQRLGPTTMRHPAVWHWRATHRSASQSEALGRVPSLPLCVANLTAWASSSSR